MPVQASAGRRVVVGAASGGAVAPPMEGFRRLGNILKDEFFDYSIVAGPFTVGNEVFNLTIPIQSDAHFLVMSTSYTNDHEVGNMAAGTATPYVRILNGGAVILLTDGGNQHFLSNIAVPVSSLFGSGELPHIWEFTHMFKANTPLGIQITGMGAVAPFAGQTIRLTFHGMKVPIGSLGIAGY